MPLNYLFFIVKNKLQVEPVTWLVAEKAAIYNPVNHVHFVKLVIFQTTLTIPA